VALLLLTLGVVVALASALVYSSWPLIDYLFLSWPGLDKVAHFLGGAVLWSLTFWGQRFALRRFALPVQVSIAFGLTTVIVVGDELLQSFSSARTVDWQDPASGLAGAVFAFAIFSFSLRRAFAFLAALALMIVVGTARSTYVRDHLFFEGIILERQSRHEEAYERYKLALLAAPESAAIYNSIAWLCLEYLRRDYVQALKWAQTGVQLDQDDPNVRDTLGWAYYKNGRIDLALREVSIAANQAPNDRIIQEHLEIIQAAVGGSPP
jgi:tetratricopeptide (TPR) repeat protein